MSHSDIVCLITRIKKIIIISDPLFCWGPILSFLGPLCIPRTELINQWSLKLLKIGKRGETSHWAAYSLKRVTFNTFSRFTPWFFHTVSLGSCETCRTPRLAPPTSFCGTIRGNTQSTNSFESSTILTNKRWPSRLMNSWAKVTSVETLASSFSESHRTPESALWMPLYKSSAHRPCHHRRRQNKDSRKTCSHTTHSTCFSFYNCLHYTVTLLTYQCWLVPLPLPTADCVNQLHAECEGRRNVRGR